MPKAQMSMCKFRIGDGGAEIGPRAPHTSRADGSFQECRSKASQRPRRQDGPNTDWRPKVVRNVSGSFLVTIAGTGRETVLIHRFHQWGAQVVGALNDHDIIRSRAQPRGDLLHIGGERRSVAPTNEGQEAEQMMGSKVDRHRCYLWRRTTSMMEDASADLRIEPSTNGAKPTASA